MMAKMGPKMVALCSAAIGLIYTAGYLVTDTADAGAASGVPLAAAPKAGMQAEPTVRPGPTPVPDRGLTREGTRGNFDRGREGRQRPGENQPSNGGSGGSAGSTGMPPAPTGTATYKDGVYNGSGTNRFGTVEVAVTVKSGKIAAVNITSSRTRYPQKYIDPLPAQVVAKQTYQVDVVSGATYSSEDFMNAVYQALLQAEKA